MTKLHYQRCFGPTFERPLEVFQTRALKLPATQLALASLSPVPKLTAVVTPTDLRTFRAFKIEMLNKNEF